MVSNPPKNSVGNYLGPYSIGNCDTRLRGLRCLGSKDLGTQELLASCGLVLRVVSWVGLGLKILHQLGHVYELGFIGLSLLSRVCYWSTV